jgi:hypothetical protein
MLTQVYRFMMEPLVSAEGPLWEVLALVIVFIILPYLIFTMKADEEN